MALSIGDPDTSGMSKAIYDALNAEFGAPDSSVEQDRKDIAKAIATGVVNHIKNNGEASITITTSDGGLQTGVAAGSPTDPPASNQTLNGTIS